VRSGIEGTCFGIRDIVAPSATCKHMTATLDSHNQTAVCFYAYMTFETPTVELSNH